MTRETDVAWIEAGLRSQQSCVRLTKQQSRALRLWRGWPYDFVTDGQVWDEARCRPWPTMDNLIAKGLIQRHGWIDEDTGWEYDLTDLGRALLAEIQDEP